MVLQLLRVKGNSVHVLLTEMKGPEKKQPLPAKNRNYHVGATAEKKCKKPRIITATVYNFTSDYYVVLHSYCVCNPHKNVKAALYIRNPLTPLFVFLDTWR